MRKTIVFSLAAIALLAFVAMPAFADGCPSSKVKKTTASAQTVGAKGCATPCSTPCTAKSTDAQKASAQCASDCQYKGQCQTASISIKGMTCAGCEGIISAALKDVPGVIMVQKVSHQDGNAVVCYDPTKARGESLTKAIGGKGYTAEIMPAVATTQTKAETVQTGEKKLSCGVAASAPCAATCASAQKEKAAEKAKTGAEGSK